MDQRSRFLKEAGLECRVAGKKGVRGADVDELVLVEAVGLDALDEGGKRLFLVECFLVWLELVFTLRAVLL